MTEQQIIKQIENDIYEDYFCRFFNRKELLDRLTALKGYETGYITLHQLNEVFK